MSFWSWLFPTKCVQCHQFSDWLCINCYQYFLRHCSFQVQTVTLPHVDHVFVSCHDYSYSLAKLLYAWKYRLCHEAGEILQNIIAQAFCATFGTTENLLCVPIPVHAQKLRDRGFNQARSIIALIESVSYIQILDLVLRQKNTRSQVGLTKAERIVNLNKAFTLNTKFLTPSLLSSRIVLIDDILTSGTTLQECAHLLRQAGFMKIDALVLHRGTK